MALAYNWLLINTDWHSGITFGIRHSILLIFNLLLATGKSVTPFSKKTRKNDNFNGKMKKKSKKEKKWRHTCQPAVRVCYSVFSLTTMYQTRIYLFVSSQNQMSLKLEPVIFLIILDVFLKFYLGFPNKVAFERCFVQQNVTKYGASAPVVKRRRSLHTNLLKKWTPIHVFSEEFDHKFRTAILKNKSRWFFLTAQNLKLFGWKLNFSNDAFQSYYDLFQVNWLVQIYINHSNCLGHS